MQNTFTSTNAVGLGELTNKWSSSSNGEDDILESTVAEHPMVDEFWIDYAKKTITDSLASLDERAKYLITTCASLIVIHFGIVSAFDIYSISFKVTPEFFFVIAIIMLSFSYFPRQARLNIESPDLIRDAYYYWKDHKLKWHRLGFFFFIVGLLAMAVTVIFGDFTLLSEPPNSAS